MTSSLLSPVLIEKLGHPIEEIRARALNSIISKYNFDLVDHTNVENIKLLLNKLFDWFNFEVHPHEDKVMKLMNKIFQKENSDIIFRESDLQIFLRKIDEIENYIGRELQCEIHKVKEHIKKIEKKLSSSSGKLRCPPLSLDKAVCINGKVNKVQEIPAFIASNFIMMDEDCCDASSDMHYEKPDSSSCFRVNEVKPHGLLSSGLLENSHKKYGGHGKERKTSKYCFPVKVEYFPWKPLVSTDLSGLTSLYENLRYLDNISSILGACQFYTDILLKDFPAEIFLQRPLLIQTFFELLHSEDTNVHIAAGNCLLYTVKNVHISLKSILDISVLNSKNYFYRKSVFQSTENSEDNGLCDLQKCMNSHLSASELKIEKEEEILSEKCHQFSLSRFCFSVLSQIIPHLVKRKHAEEYNLIFELIIETFLLFKDSLTPVIWHEKNQVKENLHKILGLFYDPLKYHKDKSKIFHCILVHIIIKILDVLKPPAEQIQEILPHGLQSQLLDCICDYIFIILFPTVHSKILFLAKKFIGQKKNEDIEEYETLIEICRSMKASVQFLKHSNKLDKLEKLNLIKRGLPSLDFHRNFQFIKDFIKICLRSSSECQRKGKCMEMCKKILIQLISHGDDGVKVNAYREIRMHVIRHLGAEEAARPQYLHPGNQFAFLIDSDILTEIICHGLNSPLTEIQNDSSEILVHILKGKFLFSENCWRYFIDVLMPCAPLLQCYADKTTSLGRCIIKMLDPDVSESISLSALDLLRGNMRLLFCKDHLIREEAVSRLTWLMTKEDSEQKKLPKLDLLRRVSLSSICSSVSPEEYSTMKEVFYSVGSLSNVMEMLSAESIEPSVRRSALSQISVMLEDLHLHSSFLEQNGVEIIIKIFENCLMEKEFQNYPDSVIPIMKILKLLSLHNASIRMQLSQDINIYYCILRGLFMFNSERKTRQHGVELLCLLLFHECIINVENDKALLPYKISLPLVIASKMCLPFLTRIHWKYSKHAQPSIRECIMLRERCARLMRITWNIEWFDGLTHIVSLKKEDLKEEIFSPSIPRDMILKTEDLESLKHCSLSISVKKCLYDIQNATTHESVIFTLHLLNSHLLLHELEYNLGRRNNAGELKELHSMLIQLPWESTLERFLLLNPSCEDDEALLIQVISTVKSLLKILKCERIYSWVGKILTNDMKILPNIIKSYGTEKSGLAHRDLARVVTELLREVFCGRPDTVPTNCLLYMSMVVQELQLKKNEFYNISHTNWLISVLVDITGISTQSIVDKAVFNTDIIIMIMEVIIALHCTKDSQYSFFGINIIKNCLHILNHMLADVHSTLQGWESLWYHALSKVTGHQEQVNYCWLLSLWYARDPVIRALAIQLLTGFTLTTRACELLMEQLHIEFEFVWQEGFELLFDERECNLVREKAALLLSNLTCHGSVSSAQGFLRNLAEISFYDKVFNIYDAFHLEPMLNEETDSEILMRFSIVNSNEDYYSEFLMSTPSLIAAVSTLLLNIMYLNSDEVTEAVHKFGLLEAITKIFYGASEICDKHRDDEFIIDIMKMYIECSKLIAKCMAIKSAAHSFIVQQSQQFINSLYSLFNYNLYSKKSEKVIEHRNRLWCEILDLFSLILAGSEDEAQEKEARSRQSEGGFRVINHAMTEHGTDNFISSLYLALISSASNLRFRCTRFLANLFGHEANAFSSVSIVDILERNIHRESVEEAESLRWKSLSICQKSDLSFGKRVCDILLQTYSLSDHEAKCRFGRNVALALGNVLAISETIQKFCMEQGLAEEIINILGTIFIKLNVESLENMKKSSEKKRIDPILCEIDTCFRLLTNLFIGNESAKRFVSDLGLSNIVQKLWHWCRTKLSLLKTTLKMLCTFTFNCETAVRSLPLHKSWSGTGLKKSHQSTLLNSVMHHVEEEMCRTSKNFANEILHLSFQLMENCCRITECRCLIVKGTFLSSFKNVSPVLLSKKCVQNDDVIDMWYNFLTVLTCYQEGQLAVTKNQDIIDAITFSLSSSKSRQRISALKIVRNICLHQLNKIQLLSHYPFLLALADALKSAEHEEITIVLHSIWALIYNSQKRKTIMRSAGFEQLLKQVKKKLKLNGPHPNLSLIDSVLKILQNRGGGGDG